MLLIHILFLFHFRSVLIKILPIFKTPELCNLQSQQWIISVVVLSLFLREWAL